MRITLRIEGGVAHFPGLARPMQLDTATLPAEEARDLERLVAQADFFARPAPGAAAPPADRRSYEINIDADAQERTLRVHDPLAPELAALVNRVRELARRRGAR